MIASFLAVLLSGDICSTLEAREPAADVTMVGTVGMDLRHAWTWVGNFGCGDRIVLLSTSDADLRASEGGRELVRKMDLLQADMVNRHDFGPVYDTGIRVRLSGGLVWAEGGGASLNVRDVVVLETDR